MPTEHLGLDVGEFVGDGERVISGVEDEQRHLAVIGEESD
jgi:hypothetical protein